MDGPKIVLFVTHNSYLFYDTYFVFYLQTASSLAYAAVSKSAQENLLQAPLLSRSNSMEASLAQILQQRNQIPNHETTTIPQSIYRDFELKKKYHIKFKNAQRSAK